MRVFKLGGSLAGTAMLKQWLDVLAGNRSCKTIIVPGGGVFAEQVRVAQKNWHFDDRAAHTMALLAMQQMACMFQGFNRQLPIVSSQQSIKASLDTENLVLWSPEITWLEQAGIPANWDITSDSLAAWLARELSATELFLVKSAPVTQAMTFQRMAEEGIVDQGFCDFIKDAPYTVKILNRQELSRFKHE